MTLADEFTRRYGPDEEPVRMYFAPGRVNLIGEHTDYNGGLVLPCAIDKGTYLAVRRRRDRKAGFNSLNLSFTMRIDLSEGIRPQGHEWINYPLGVMKEFADRGVDLGGMDFLFSGNIPNGAGLSSSASLEMVTAVALNDLPGAGFSRTDLVKMCQHAENEFVGMKCGIMDQFAVGMGKKDHAVFLDCATLEHRLVPVPGDRYSLVISNTNKRRELTGSEYNTRRAECEKAVQYLDAVTPVRNLGEVGYEDFLELQSHIPEKTVRLRAAHVVSENHRVRQAVEALQAGDFDRLGRLMYESHESLRRDYQVSCTELDVLVEEAAAVQGVAGSRMTGAGFGGCTVSFVLHDKVENFMAAVGERYAARTGLKADFYVARAGEGARKVPA
jgi:galactokinase